MTTEGRARPPRLDVQMSPRHACANLCIGSWTCVAVTAYARLRAGD